MNKETTNKPIRSEAREVILNVFQRCFAEYQAGRIISDLEDVYARTELMMEKSESTFRRIVNEGFTNNGVFKTPPGKKRVGRPKKEMDDCCEHVIKIEKEYHERGRTLYSDIDDLIIQVESNDSSSNSDLSGVDYLEVSSE